MDLKVRSMISRLSKRFIRFEREIVTINSIAHQSSTQKFLQCIWREFAYFQVWWKANSPPLALTTWFGRTQYSRHWCCPVKVLHLRNDWLFCVYRLSVCCFRDHWKTWPIRCQWSPQVRRWRSPISGQVDRCPGSQCSPRGSPLPRSPRGAENGH